MRVLLLGSDYLAPSLRGLGCSVLTCGPHAKADLPLDELDPDWRGLTALLGPRRQKVDAVLVCDDVGMRKLPIGLSAAEAVTVFYGVDSPLNRFWQMPYAKLFDLAFLDQPAEAQVLAASHPGAAWLPVAVDPGRYQGARSDPPRASLCFVGVVNDSVRPKRSALLKRVARLAPLTVRGGRQEAWFPTSRAVGLYQGHAAALNENLFPGVTTRPLEIMAAGGLALSEAAPGAMDRFFQDGEHLLFFSPDDLEQKIELCLKDQALGRRVGAAGRELVRAQHSLEARCREIVKQIEVMAAMPLDQRARAAGGEALRLEGEALLMAGLRWPAKGGARRVIRGAARLEAAAGDGAKPLPASRAAGLAALTLGRAPRALAHLARAAELGGEAEHLLWNLAAQSQGQAPQGAGLPGRLGQAGFHRQAAAILARTGQAVGAGFARGGLHPCFWTALEHLLEATRLEPSAAPAWEQLGRLLLEQGAPNQAHGALARARHLRGGGPAGELELRAAREGYLS